MLRAVERFFVSWRFAVFTVTLLVGCSAWIALLLWLPPAPSGVGAFAEDFRRWCFGPGSTPANASGLMVFGFFFELLSLASLIGFFWLKPLREQLARAVGPVLPYGAAGGLAAAALALSLGSLRGGAGSPTEFPERELRTALPAPRLELTNQDGARVSLEQLRGKVVVVTAVYARCGLACPKILGQARRVVAGLTPELQAEVAVLGVTLDPEHDDRPALVALAAAQEIKAPLYQLLTGETAAVNAALDAFGVSRRRDPKTGVIDHANLFVLIDRQGRIAYRFSLSELQEQWMRAGLRALLREPAVPLTAARN